MKHYTHTKRQEERKITLFSVFLSILGFGILFGLTLLGLLGPVWDAVDNWLSASMENQIKFAYILMIVCACAFGMWAYVRYKSM